MTTLSGQYPSASGWVDAPTRASLLNMNSLDPALEAPRYRYTVLAMLVLVYTFNFIDRQIVGILAGPIKAELGLS